MVLTEVILSELKLCIVSRGCSLLFKTVCGLSVTLLLINKTLVLFKQLLFCLVFRPQNHDYLNSRRRGKSKRLTRDLPLVKLLNISITLSPFLGVDTSHFHNSLSDGTEAYWLGLPSATQGQLVRHERTLVLTLQAFLHFYISVFYVCQVPVMSQWRGTFCVKLNVSNTGAVSWFLDRVGSLQAHLGMEYVILEGGEGNPFEEQALRAPQSLTGDRYISQLADLATRIGDSTIVTAGTR